MFQLCDEIKLHNGLSCCRFNNIELNISLVITEGHLFGKDIGNIQAHASNLVELGICWQYLLSSKVPLGKSKTEE